MSRSDGPLAWAAIDFLCCLLLVVYTLIAPPPTPKSSVEAEGRVLVRVTWQPGTDFDVDTWVQSPNGETVSFLAQQVGGMFLNRDDLGITGDRAREYYSPTNEERVTVLAPQLGEYTINVFLYRGEGPVAVTVRLYKLGGADRLIATTRVVLREKGSEATAFRFSLDSRERVHGLNRLSKQLATPAP